MEKVKIIAGGLISALIIMGALFKSMHWPGAGIMIVLGASSLSLYAVLSSGAMKFKPLFETEFGSLKDFTSKKSITGLSTSVLAVGLLFKIQHWPGAGPMIVVGLTSLAIISLLYIITFLSKKETLVVNAPLFYCVIGLFGLVYAASITPTPTYLFKDIIKNAKKIEDNSLALYKTNQVLGTNNKKVEIITKTNQLITRIENIKRTIYERVDMIPAEVADTISINQIDGIDNYDIPTYIMGLSDPARPSETHGYEECSALKLKEKIKNFNKFVTNYDKSLSINIEDIKDPKYGYVDTWETGTFYHYPLSNVILKLNQIQLEANIICNTILTNNLLQATNTQLPDTIN